MEREKVAFCWSGGKDSALALYMVLKSEVCDVEYLLTTINAEHKRISMHGIREELLEQQAEAIGIPLKKVYVSEGTNEEYERKMTHAFNELADKGIKHVIYGDIFLEDLRKYRDQMLEKCGVEGIYPLWKENTKELIHWFIQLNFKTVTCCVSDQHLNQQHVGRVIDEQFVKALPDSVDPCGENGEFHTFVFDGPIFQYPVNFQISGEVYQPLEIRLAADDDHASNRQQVKGFWFSDILPSES